MLCLDVDTGEHIVVELLVSPVSRLTELRSLANESSEEAVLERFASEHLEAVERVLPALGRVVAGLRLPVPVGETDVCSVEVIDDSAVATLVYGEGVLGPVPASAVLTVTGRSPDGAFWRVRCPDESVRECWVPSDATEDGAVRVAHGSAVRDRQPETARTGCALHAHPHFPGIPTRLDGLSSPA